MNIAQSIDDIIPVLEQLGCIVQPCGSRVTCSPAPNDTDADYLVEVDAGAGKMQRISDVVAAMHGFLLEWEGSEHYQSMMADDFMSWRRDDINLIVTANPAFAARHRVATALCKRLNLMSKPDRIALFQAVLYGVEWDGTSNKLGIEKPVIAPRR